MHRSSALPDLPAYRLPRRGALLAGLSLLAPLAWSAPASTKLPPATRLVFKVQGRVKGIPYQANADLVWEPQGTTYTLWQEIRLPLVGSRKQTSQGNLSAQGLQPLNFVDESRKKVRSTRFDYATQQALFSPSGETAPVTAKVQDRLSVFLQLSALIAAAPKNFGRGKEIQLETASTHSVEPWTFKVQGSETLDLPIGRTPALRLQRLARKPDDQQAEIWLAPGLNYLPVRIRLSEDDGEQVDLNLQSQSRP